MSVEQTEIAQESLFMPVRFYPAERDIFRKKEDLTTSQWAAKYRVVTMGGHKGPWRNEVSPHLTFIMDAWGLPHVREVVVCKSPQTGGTEVMYNCLAYAVDRDPAEMMVIMPSQETARKVSEDRIIPMITQSPRIGRHISDNPDDTAKQRVKLRNGSILYMAWSNSASALATFAIKYLFFDETDKYPPFVGKESDPISLGEKRARTFRHTHKILKASSPTREDGPIWKALQRCDAVYHYFARCPDCGHEQPFTIEKLRYPQDKTPEDIRRDHLAAYECRACFKQWTDGEKEGAVRAGKWTIVKGENVSRPRRVGFHLPSWISPDVSLSEIAAAWINAKADRAKLIDFYNDYLAEPFIEKFSARKEDAILKLKDDRPAGTVPPNISTLLVFADTQKRGFYYEVVAFGWGPLLETWQVRNGFVETFEGLNDILLHSEYKDRDGKSYTPQAGFIDSGGGTGRVPKHSRTAEVYTFCLQNPLWRPLKGYQVLTTPVATTRIDFIPGSKTPIPGGLVLYRLNVTFFKDYLAGKLAINANDPGAWHLHSEVSEDYAKQMIVEYQDKQGRWQCPDGKANHYWDLGVYRLAAAEIMQIKFWKRPEEARPAGRRVVSRGVQ